MSDDLWDQVESGTITADPAAPISAARSSGTPADDLWSQVERGQIAAAPRGSTASSVTPTSDVGPLRRLLGGGPSVGENPVNAFVEGYARRTATGMAGTAAGGLRGLWDLALGRGVSRAASDIGATEDATDIAPESAGVQAGAMVAGSKWNPLNWPGMALGWTGHQLGGAAERLGAPPIVSAALDTAPSAAALLYGPVRGFMHSDWSPYEVESENTAPLEAGAQSSTGGAQSLSAASVGKGAIPAGAPAPDGPPIEGGLPEEYHAEREAILGRVGLGNARESAITGDAKDAASDFQLTKFDEPTGRAAAAQFEAERNALAQHAESIVANTGGTIGMDEDTLAARGAMIARPFDQLRTYFDDRTRELYGEANARAQGAPVTNLEGVDSLLQNPQFRNTLLAKNQGNLLSAVENQLARFRENSPQGFNAAGAEQVRQWFNQVWTNDNKWAVGQLKDALDSDVLQGAGEDIYAQARAIRMLKRTTLEDPRGISSLFDFDPNTPINRSTALEKIPDKLSQLPLDQFSNVLQTLRSMPEEIQPDAQAALSEIKAQLANKLLAAGAQTTSGAGRALWGADRVSSVLRTNEGKFQAAFGDDPRALAAISDLDSAGRILKVDPSYPGAAAQAANAVKRGLLSRAITHVGGSIGAGIGGVIAGPLGAGVGGAAGEAAGSSVGASAAEHAALRAWQKRVRPLGSNEAPAK